MRAFRRKWPELAGGNPVIQRARGKSTQIDGGNPVNWLVAGLGEHWWLVAVGNGGALVAGDRCDEVGDGRIRTVPNSKREFPSTGTPFLFVAGPTRPSVKTNLLR